MKISMPAKFYCFMAIRILRADIHLKFSKISLLGTSCVRKSRVASVLIENAYIMLFSNLMRAISIMATIYMHSQSPVTLLGPTSYRNPDDCMHFYSPCATMTVTTEWSPQCTQPQVSWDHARLQLLVWSRVWSNYSHGEGVKSLPFRWHKACH
jgi:hypothetical protein